MRIAKGIRIKPRFLRRERLCQTGKLRLILLDNQPRGVTYEQMLGDLTKIRNRIARRLRPDSLAIVDACRKAYVGKGSFIVDARPSFADVLPGSLYVFLSPPTAKGAIGGFGVMTYYDQRAPIIRNTSLLRDQQPVFTVNLFNDPTPDGVLRLPHPAAARQLRAPAVQRRRAARREQGPRRHGPDPQREDHDGLLGDAAPLPRVRQPAVQGRLPLQDGPADEHHRPGAVPEVPALSRWAIGGHGWRSAGRVLQHSRAALQAAAGCSFAQRTIVPVPLTTSPSSATSTGTSSCPDSSRIASRLPRRVHGMSR